jgi:hypothetical protein
MVSESMHRKSAIELPNQARDRDSVVMVWRERLRRPQRGLSQQSNVEEPMITPVALPIHAITLARYGKRGDEVFFGNDNRALFDSHTGGAERESGERRPVLRAVAFDRSPESLLHLKKAADEWPNRLALHDGFWRVDCRSVGHRTGRKNVVCRLLFKPG